MYYIIIPKTVIDGRGVFTNSQRLSDGSAVVPLSETRFTRFSYGEVKLLNDSDTAALIAEDKSAKENSDEPNK